MLKNSPEMQKGTDWAELVQEGFGLDEAMVLEARDEAHKQNDYFETQLTLRDDEHSIQLAESALPVWKEYLEVLSASPEIVLLYLRQVYDRFAQCIQSGMDISTTTKIIMGEFPELMKYYSLFESTRWGSALGEQVFVELRRELRIASRSQ